MCTTYLGVYMSVCVLCVCACVLCVCACVCVVCACACVSVCVCLCEFTNMIIVLQFSGSHASLEDQLVKCIGNFAGNRCNNSSQSDQFTVTLVNSTYRTNDGYCSNSDRVSLLPLFPTV